MSETVREKGTIKLIERLENETLDEQIIRLFKEDMSEWDFKYPKDHIGDRDDYIIINNKLYRLNYKSLDTDYSLFEADKNDDGSINFHVMYYNGGCSLSEAIEEAIKNNKLEE